MCLFFTYHILCWIFIPDVLTEDIRIVYLILISLNLGRTNICGMRNLHSKTKENVLLKFSG